MAVEPRAQIALGRMDLELPEEKLAAGLHFVREGRAILRRPALHNIADVDVCTA